jgi:benzaldehyde dehydrogenase (NAD)
MSATTEPAAGAEIGSLLDESRWTGKIFSDGWVDAPVEIETVEPATGEVLGTAGGGDAETIARAARSAAAAQVAWAETPFTDRVAIVRRAAELMERNRDELAGWLTRESGSIPGKVAHEITASIGQLDMAASLVSHPLGLVLPSLTPGRTSTARRVPLGVVGVITPWNFPYVLAMRSVGSRARQRRRPQA